MRLDNLVHTEVRSSISVEMVIKLSDSKFADLPRALRKSVHGTKVSYPQLGRCGLRISNPILGGMSIGDPRWSDWVLPRDKALPLLKAAYDRGINTWDTANGYSNGLSERIMGEALRKYSIPRRKVVIMTKCFRVVGDVQDDDEPSAGYIMNHAVAQQSKDYVNQCGLSRAAIFNSVEASLERLQTTYIDLLQIHRFDNEVPPEETMCALHDLVRAGKVRYLGASSMWTHQFATLQFTAERHNWTKFVAMQNHYNLLYREEEREMNRFCEQTGVGLIPWSPFASGRLVRSAAEQSSSLRCATSPNGSFYAIPGDDCDTIIARVHEIATRRGWPPSHVVLAWLNQRVTAPVIGFSSADRMDEVLAARDRKLTAEEEEYLETPYQPKEIIGHS